MQFLAKQWFLLTLLSILAIGQLASSHLQWLPQVTGLRVSLVVGVMFVMSIGVPLESIIKHVSKPWPTLLAVLINMGILPLIAYVSSFWLPPSLAGGLIVAASIPCTLASAAVWTRRAGGDDTIAMLVMLVTNISCFIVTPLWLAVLLDRTVELDTTKLMIELLLYVLLPSIAAQIVRASNKSVTQWIARNKSPLSFAGQIGLLGMVLLGSIQMHKSGGEQGANGFVAIGQTIATTSGVHVAAMLVGWFASQAAGMPRPERIGVAISGSQKTLMVGLQLCIDCGVSILPMVLYHVCQLVIDTVVADWWHHYTPKPIEIEAVESSSR